MFALLSICADRWNQAFQRFAVAQIVSEVGRVLWRCMT